MKGDRGLSMVTDQSEAHSADVYAWPSKPSPAQLAWLKRGLEQPGGKLPLFDRDGQRVDPRTVQTGLQTDRQRPAHSDRALIGAYGQAALRLSVSTTLRRT